MPPSSRRNDSQRPANRSAARRPRAQSATGRVAPAGPTSSRFTGRSAILVLIALVLFTAYASSLRAWLQQQDALQAARTQISTSSRSIDELKQDKRRFSDSAYVEQQARERFGWVLPGEVGYRVLGADGKATGNSPGLVDRPIATPDKQWYHRLWGSVEQAAKKPAPASPKTTKAPDSVIKPDKADTKKDP